MPVNSFSCYQEGARKIASTKRYVLSYSIVGNKHVLFSEQHVIDLVTPRDAYDLYFFVYALLMSFI